MLAMNVATQLQAKAEQPPPPEARPTSVLKGSGGYIHLQSLWFCTKSIIKAMNGKQMAWACMPGGGRYCSRLDTLLFNRQGRGTELWWAGPVWYHLSAGKPVRA